MTLAGSPVRLIPVAATVSELQRRVGAIRGGWTVAVPVLATATALTVVGVTLPETSSPEWVGRWLFLVAQGMGHAVALGAGVLAGAASLPATGGRRSLDTLRMAHGSPHRLVWTRMVGALAVALVPVTAMAPVMLLPGYFTALSLRAAAMGVVTQAVLAVLGTALGVRIAAETPGRHRVGLSLAITAAVGAGGWLVAGRALGPCVCHHLHTAYLGAVWWPAALADTTASHALRVHRRWGALGTLSVTVTLVGWLLSTAAARTEPAAARQARVATWVLAGMTTCLAVACTHAADGRALRAWVASMGALAIGGLATVCVADLLSHPLAGSRRVVRGSLAHAAVTHALRWSLAVACVALDGWLTARRQHHGGPLAAWMPWLVGGWLVAWVVGVTGVGTAARVVLGVRSGRRMTFGVLCLGLAAPYPLAAGLAAAHAWPASRVVGRMAQATPWAVVATARAATATVTSRPMALATEGAHTALGTAAGLAAAGALGLWVTWRLNQRTLRQRLQDRVAMGTNPSAAAAAVTERTAADGAA